MSRARLNIFLEPAHARRLQELAAHRGVSKSALIAAALSAFLASPETVAQRELTVLRRLDRLSRQFDRLERDQNLLIEALALYVRIYLSLSLPVPEEQQDAARAQGRARYAQFVDQLGRQLQRGRSLARELGEELEGAARPAGAAVHGMEEAGFTASASADAEGEVDAGDADAARADAATAAGSGTGPAQAPDDSQRQDHGAAS